jgi:phosphotransferase system enzyme I (PtsI)
MRLTGIGVSPGVAMGQVHLMPSDELQVQETTVPPDRVEAEVEGFRRALERARQELVQIRDGIAVELGPDEALIYEAQIMLVDDPDARRAVEGAIRGEHRNAAFLFCRHISEVAGRVQMRAKEDYLRERLADLLDVERRVLDHLLGRQRHAVHLEQPAIVVAHDLLPSDTAQFDPSLVLGIATDVGGRTSHSAIVARSRGIPAVVGLRHLTRMVKDGDRVVVDGYRGEVEVNPDEPSVAAYQTRRARFEAQGLSLAALRDAPAATPDGHVIELSANIELPAEVDQVVAAGAEGVGLFRTEFFYLDRASLPSEDEQLRAYRLVAERVAPRPVIIRTMDLGGDKVASYLGTLHETNPFLGWRGIRFALHHPEVFRTQLRAIYRASVGGNVRMMFPMVSSLEELRRANELCQEARVALERAGLPFDRELQVGVMIETPAAVWVADWLAREAQFFSIGTNDLIQYTLAMDRGNERVAHLYEPLDPAVLRAIQRTIEAGRAANRWVGVCGEMAGDPRLAVVLLGLGASELSVAIPDLQRVKAAVRSVPASLAREVAVEALGLPSAREVRALVRARVDPLLPEFLLGDVEEA